MVQGPDAGLALLEGLDERLGDHHRLHSVRAHLLELSGDEDGAIAERNSYGNDPTDRSG